MGGDVSSDSGSSYGQSAEAEERKHLATAACGHVLPPRTTEDEDVDFDLQLADDVVSEDTDDVLALQLKKGKFKAYVTDSPEAEELAEHYNSHGDNSYNDFKTWLHLKGEKFPEEFEEGKNLVQCWNRGATKLYHEKVNKLPAEQKLALHQACLADIVAWGGDKDSDTSMKGGRKTLNQFSNLAKAYSQMFGVEIV
ncbi:hypothetical protein DXG01_016291 [Tephrocybe rancida]|nr:hypothetical protein DXG01_016291 [Tephrocybe rancida]